jgi:polysaccharide pyruvyl transferase CsaB
VKNQGKSMSPSKERDLVVISGYYGFGNLGDEAILEEIVAEVKRLVSVENIYVLSNNPQNTARTYGVKAVSRWKLGPLFNLLPRTRLVISGGGGLFQDSSSAKPPLFYGTQIALARFFGVPVFVFAQGIGPLKSGLSQAITRGALSLATLVTIRDKASQKVLENWGVKCELTADPVWNLDGSPLPQGVVDQIDQLRGKRDVKKGFIPYGSKEIGAAVEAAEDAKPKLLVGLSLRPSANFTQESVEQLADVLDQTLPDYTKLLLLPLQREQDMPVLEQFNQLWQKRGRSAENFYAVHLDKPSQWITLLGQLDLLVGMRLHAVIMALKCKVPVIGLAYDPKVSHVLEEFKQPILNLQNENDEETKSAWIKIVTTALEDSSQLSKVAGDRAEAAKNMAGQNFVALSRILGTASNH